VGPLTKRIMGGLGVLLVASIVVRVSAQLIAPAIPLLLVLFVMAASAYWVFNRRS